MELVNKLLLVDDDASFHEVVDGGDNYEVRVNVWLHEVDQEQHLVFCVVLLVKCQVFSIFNKYFLLFYTLLYVLVELRVKVSLLFHRAKELVLENLFDKLGRFDHLSY